MLTKTLKYIPEVEDKITEFFIKDICQRNGFE